MAQAAEIAREAVTLDDEKAHRRDRALDRLLTSKATGIPAMLLLLAGVLWLTMVGANVPSELLYRPPTHPGGWRGRWWTGCTGRWPGWYR